MQVRVARAPLLVLSFVVAACSKPDLSPIRDGLVKNAAIVCAPPPARPAHAPKVRDVSTADLTAAIVALCDAQLAHADAPAGPAGVLHDALLADRANVGEVRRNDISAKSPADIKCNAAFPTLDRVLLRAATSTKDANEALDRCADVIALARDEDLAGTATDLLFANGHVQAGVAACLPIVEHAAPEAARRFHKALVILRATFPTSIDDAVAREHAESVIVEFGQVQETPFACPRATLLATESTRHGDPAELLASWRAAKPTSPPDEYREAYALTLGALDRLVSLADLVSQPSSSPRGAPAASARAHQGDAQAP